MASIFSKIIAGDIPAHKVGETDKYLAFLDIFPLQRGHTLVVPKREEDKFFDLDAEEITDLMVFAQKIAKGIEKTFDCDRVGLSVIGLEVPHAHVHLIPINRMVDMSFEQSKIKLTQEELADIAARIRANIED